MASRPTVRVATSAFTGTATSNTYSRKDRGRGFRFVVVSCSGPIPGRSYRYRYDLLPIIGGLR